MSHDALLPSFRRYMPRLLRGHPPVDALERHHAGELDGSTRSRLDRHLATCAECREWFAWRTSLSTAARELARSPVPRTGPVEALTGALRRRAAGERVQVPTELLVPPPAGLPRVGAVVPRANSAKRWAALTGTAASVALAAMFLGSSGQRVDAGTVGGELTITPANPRPGGTITVRYRPSAFLAGAPRLRLRATYHPDDDSRPWSRPAITATWLTPAADGGYRGRVTLPPAAAYVRFAVEDSAARTVDAHGHVPWDVIVADTAGRPRIAGVRSQGMASHTSEWERQREIVLEATRLHPDHPSPWRIRAYQDMSLVRSARADSVRTAARPLVARLDTALARVAAPESWAMLDLGEFADFAGLPDVRQRWRARLLRAAPRSAAAYSLRVMGLMSGQVAPAEQLDSLERWWSADGDSISLFLTRGVDLASAARDTAGARRWAARVLAVDPAWTELVAQQLVRDPALAAAGVDYARARIARTATGDAERPLDMDAGSWARERARRARAALAIVGEGLLTLGRPREAAAALADATADGWNAGAFRLLGEARLAAGDTAGAVAGFAYAAADPILGARLADSLGTRLGGRARDTAWARAVADARRTMHGRVLGETVAEPPRGDPRLASADGRRRPLSEVTAGRVAVVAMLSRFCGPALADLPAVARLHAGIGQRPVAFVALTREAPGEAVGRDLRARGLTIPLWYDADREATSMLDARGTPTYLVLDERGTVRWRGHRIRDASPVLDALLARRPGA